GGSAGVDLAVAGTITISDEQVHIVDSQTSGPLGHGLAALLLGRSNMSKRGIFILPGVVNADYTGIIKIMIKVFIPPVTIPEGSKVAQLIPFLLQVPKSRQVERRDRGFGSTGDKLVLLTQKITLQRPKVQVTIRNESGEDLTQLLNLKDPIIMLLDIGSDVTIIP
ncbi:POK9 protein, partial [Copsychus sechellarum]|nr:POK9 protein [Copsychus sechellarum]